MAAYINAVVNVGTTATLLTTVSVGDTGLVVQNNGAVAVFIGGPNVTADTTATGGISIAAGATLSLSVAGDQARDLWGRTASSTANVGTLRA